MWSRRHVRVHAASRRGLYATAVVPFALAVREHAVAAVDVDSSEPPIAPNERVVKRWELQQSETHAVNRVHISVPGLTYVSYDSGPKVSDTVATVRVTGDSPELVECIEVVPLPPNGINVRWKAKQCAQLKGHLLTSLSLAREEQVNELRARGNGTVVVEDGVLVADGEHASVRVSTEGIGDMFVTSQRRGLNLHRLELSAFGTGTLQFIGPDEIKLREKMQIKAVGEANVHAFMGQIATPFVKSMVAGSGHIAFVPSGALQVDKIKTSIVGSGHVDYNGEGHCRVQRCTIAGSGKITARGIQCQEASAETYGEADVTWNVTDKVQASGLSTTTMRFVDDKPKVVMGKNVSLRPAPPIDEATAKRLEPAAAPPKEAAFAEIVAAYECQMGTDDDPARLHKAVRYVIDAMI